MNNVSLFTLHDFRGIGVIGEQPVILPKTGFEYSSACPLTTPSGRMVRGTLLPPSSLQSCLFVLFDS